MDDEYQGREHFGMEYDYENPQYIAGEFFHTGKKNRSRIQTKDDAIYGTFAVNSSDSDSDGRPSRKRRNRDRLIPDLTKPVNFISTGTVNPNQEPKIDDDGSSNINHDHTPGQGLGFGLGFSGLGFKTDVNEETNEDVEEHVEVDESFLPNAFGRKIIERAQRKEKEREMEKRSIKASSSKQGSKNTEAGKFDTFADNKGFKLLKKMGYTGGGLGKDEQGITAPIEVKLRPKNMGMGFNDYKESKMPVLDNVEAETKLSVTTKVAVSKEKRWSKKKQGKKSADKYVTAEELLLKKQEEGLEDVKVQKVLDMRGPQVRILSNLENLNAEEEAKENDVPMPELQHNIKLILDMAEVDIQKIDRDLRREREKVVSLQREKEKFQKEAARQKKQIDVMEVICKIVEKAEEDNLAGVLTLESLLSTFGDLKKRFGDDYKLCNLSSIVCSLAYPLLIRVFQGWEPLKNPHHGMQLMASWKDLLQGDQEQPFDYSESAMDASPYAQLVNEVIFPAIRISGTNTWQARDPEPMLSFLELWENLLPPLVLQSILENIVMPELLKAVDIWDPCRETVPIHVWVHPWLPLLGQRLEALYHTIQFKFRNVLQAWQVSDSSACTILSPWKDVFDARSWERLIAESILPKLMIAMQEFQVNPANQNLDHFNWVMIWASAVPIHHMVNLLEIGFFRKWHHALYQWLCSTPDFNEVMRWYTGWKSLFPATLLENERIRLLFASGLDMMKQAAEGMTVVQPGTRENISYLRATEHRQFEAQQAALKMHAESMINATLKEKIQDFAESQGVMFAPKDGKLHNNLPVYGFGSINICMDYVKQLVYAQSSGGWVPVSLTQLLQMHHSAGQRY